ncbi:hypothetical protein G5714_019167 [Onychostoma macrolepis]|uniref:VWFA domain-containing protein n=1 Tax=Onychostoma macrolepis TaxID=369639 RepID=A0A7J6C1P3_9TELE|nr:hypothetical protein G5714_019167 [Onychostoma macrolepis]
MFRVTGAPPQKKLISTHQTEHVYSLFKDQTDLNTVKLQTFTSVAPAPGTDPANAGRALTYILENSFKAESGSRPDVPKIVILITDGKSQDDVLSPAQRLRDAGIELFVIGVKNADENELRAIASPPEETHVYNAADFSFMLDIIERLSRSVCERVSELSRDISVFLWFISGSGLHVTESKVSTKPTEMI